MEANWRLAKRMGFREMLDFDEMGIPYPYVGVSTLKVNVKKESGDHREIGQDPHGSDSDI